MRTVKFRDVLWSVARKAGYSPESGNFLSNQAIPVGEYINDWVGRLYTQEDWPEWTKVIPISPVNHVVPYERAIGANEAPDSPAPYVIGRVLTVYLTSPNVSRAPVSTRFALLEDGIHCGYEHGGTVWIKYLEPSPKFTAVPWRPDFKYRKGDAVYSSTTGECYRSLVNNNRGNDPASGQDPIPPELTIEETQPLTLGDAGSPPQTQILDCIVEAIDAHVIADPPPSNDELELRIDDTSGTPLGAHSQLADGIKTIQDLLDGFKTMFDGDALPGFTFTVTGPTTFRIESTTTEFVLNYWKYAPDIVHLYLSFNLRFITVQPFSAGSAAVDGLSQKLKITIGDNAFIPGALYQITITDLDGIEHIVEYQSDTFDNKIQILNGLLLAVGASTDLTVNSIATTLDTAEPSATLMLNRMLGVSAAARPPASQFWALVPFPEALYNPVVRGASAALMGEWGQFAAQSTEEQKVPWETDTNRGDFDTTPNPLLTTQQKALSRYKIAR